MIHREPQNLVHFTSVALAELKENYPKFYLLFPFVNYGETSVFWHHFLNHFNQKSKYFIVFSFDLTPSLEKEMATHSSILAWKIPWMEESRRLQFMGSQRVR